MSEITTNQESKQKGNLTLKDALLSYKEQFESSLVDERLEFHAEMHFAMQALENNSYLLDVAKNNPSSLRNAIVNIGATGLSLNPVRQLAYLVPRKVNKRPAICLDISYKGLVTAATESGSILWVNAEIVYEHDVFTMLEAGKMPKHEYDPFQDRGKIIGAYAVVKTKQEDFLATPMNIEEIFQIRNSSEAFKKGYGPWISFQGEMIKKTVVKRAAKMWPRNENFKVLEKTIAVANEYEGIDFEAEKKEYLDYKKSIDEDYPRKEEDCQKDLNYLFIWGKPGVRGKRIKDIDESVLENYFIHLNKKFHSDKRYQTGDKYETYSMIKDFLENKDDYYGRYAESPDEYNAMWKDNEE